MDELRKFVAPEFIFGPGALDSAGSYARQFAAEKVLLVTDEGVLRAGWAQKVAASLEKEGLTTEIHSNVSPNPRDHEVMEGAETFLKTGCDLMVAVGGGSPIDCAKGIGIVSSNEQHILEFEGVDRVPVPGPPLICVPTTAGSSADISQFSIICDSRRMVKVAIISKSVVPDLSLIDPATTTTLSKKLTAETGMDALAMVMGLEPFRDPQETRQALLETLAGFRKRLGITTRLSSLGISKEELPALADFAMTDPCIVTNPVMPTKKEIEEIYDKAF